MSDIAQLLLEWRATLKESRAAVAEFDGLALPGRLQMTDVADELEKWLGTRRSASTTRTTIRGDWSDHRSRWTEPTCAH
jgi:hypothetical protein